MLFIDDSQVGFLEDIMWDQGYLEGGRCPARSSFSVKRSHLVPRSHEYLMGQRAPMIDLMAWNADATRMPLSHAQRISAPTLPAKRSFPRAIPC